MPSDPEKPLLRLTPQDQGDRPTGKQRSIPRPEPFPRDRQTAAFAPKFNRLAEVLARDPTGLQLRADPTALAPERLLVFEVRGSIASFAAVVRRVPGLELVDEEELAADEDRAPVAYLMVPDIQALRNIELLWRRWQRGQLAQGETPWRDIFSLLRDLRPWGPTDRVQAIDINILADEIDGRGDDEGAKLEIELVFRGNDHIARDREEEVSDGPGRPRRPPHLAMPSSRYCLPCLACRVAGPVRARNHRPFAGRYRRIRASDAYTATEPCDHHRADRGR